MTQRKIYSKPSSKRNKKAHARKVPPSKYNFSPKKSISPPQRKDYKKRGGSIIWLLVIVILVVVGIFVGSKFWRIYSDNIICSGITIDGTDISGMSYDRAYNTLLNKTQSILNSISINLHYGDQSWHFDAQKLEASVDIEAVLKEAQKLGHEGSISERLDAQKLLKEQGSALKTSIKINKQVLIDALDQMKSQIDNPMVEATIEFDPSNYNFFEDYKDDAVNMARDMFTIKEGIVGFVMDYEDAKNQLEEALAKGYVADIRVKVMQANPRYTVEELEMCTTLLFHSSSKISTSNSRNDNRNHNILKALGYYKGLVVWPGDIISYNDMLGERTEQAGWLKAPTITPQKTLKDELGGGICQVSTTIFNAAFMSGAKILDQAPHSWPAYHNDFGYGMDAMVNYGTSDFIFQNTSDYPMFFDAYVWISPSSGKPKYIDVDVYGMPQEDGMHIRPECIIEERRPPAEPEYIEDTDGKYADEEWKLDTTLNKMTYTLRKPKDLVKVRVSKVWYKDCVETDPGVWEGGIEVKREESHHAIYDSVTAIIYTKPIEE